MLTVLQVGAFPFPSHQGSQVYVAGMSRALARRARVLLACWAGSGAGAIPEGVRIVRTRWVPGSGVLHSGPHPGRPLQDLLLARTVRRILRTEAIDVIHAHNVEAPLAAWLARGRRRHPPVIYDLHTTMRHELPTYGTPGPWAGRGVRAVGAVVDAVVPRVCDGAVAMSEPAQRELLARGVAPVALIPPGIDPEQLQGASAPRARRRWGLGDHRWVVYAGNADGYQDLPDLFAAVALLPSARLLVVTGSPLPPLAAMASAAGVGGSRLRLVRSTSLADTADALAVATVAALPRRRCAGFPIKLLNQLCLGVPTVAAGGSARAIPGVIPVPAADPVAFAAALQALLSDPVRCRALGRAARRAVLGGWTWAARAEQLLRFYHSLAP
ncbi:MAG TPA: glycosyltransferase [Deltaproteobacteria bacterium]|nr:glycosyltransferase [Deltaproteobacteria bacterium]